MSSTLESYELIRFAEAFEGRIATAGEMLAGRPGLEAEKSWLTTAFELVRTTRAPAAGVVDRVKDLPELDEAREEYAFHQQGLWVDALEKLHAGITFTASSRAPVIEALFPHLKFAQLRRAPREVIFEYATSYERRTRSSYVSRIFAREDFALVRPVMDQVAAAHAAWRASHEPAPLSLEQEAVLREELVNLGRKLEVALRQARLLSEAALVPVPSVHEAAALGLKPKRKAGRGLAPSDDGLGALDLEPSDSMEPTEAELAEVAALDSSSDDAEPSALRHRAGSNPAATEPLDTDEPVDVDVHSTRGKNEAQSAPALEGVEDASVSEDLGTSEPAPSAVESPASEGGPVQVGARGRKRDANAFAPVVESGSDATGVPAPSGRDSPLELDGGHAPMDEPVDTTEEPRASGPRGRKRDAEGAPTSVAEGADIAGTSRPATGRGRKRGTEPGSTSADAASAPEGVRGQVTRGRARDSSPLPTPGGDTADVSADSRAQSSRGRARDSSAPSASTDTATPEGSRAQAPAVRKKKGVTSTPGAAGTETP
ncbi:hypothetical protein FJV41_12385 [Myxococcus llanfairpwllgwyngyllgogerychwyrndrobwllllantysiliogogogochensis]|uniref:Uncharacterized protein n=1 Tax=Myxococcus llanfairpwllgwyngyllgogerychwyrndrobwllllantysiliogogogochensis TaxID=2590453 RepID=A0A540X345_9BACT|nr:hypothetical protein [Myxococcus llanfairpwllgwyngyllgogerychwyrndrobwllllantysiliogogogochensis]TQF15677.1 hypothetical protein FJV41_12385 [Myxococcus llanfairpwllgwyngyllgogerychwyrndrobwllllantysiliogogogochensis]